MSAGIYVFDTSLAPQEFDSFMEWWTEARDWPAGSRHNDTALTSPALRAWHADMLSEHPESAAVGYTIGPALIYIPLPASGDATDHAFFSAGCHGLGFIDCTDSEPQLFMWNPDSNSLSRRFSPEQRETIANAAANGHFDIVARLTGESSESLCRMIVATMATNVGGSFGVSWNNGYPTVTHHARVVDVVRDPRQEIGLDTARQWSPDIEVGDVLKRPAAFLPGHRSRGIAVRLNGWESVIGGILRLILDG